MLVFDTHQYIKNLMESGVPQEQAEVHADELKNIITQDLATKQDLENTELRLNAKIDSSVKDLDAKIDSSVKDLDTKIDSSVKELRGEIQDVKHEINLLKWMIGFVFAGILSLMAKTFFG